MLTKIKIDDLEIYTNEIIHPDSFKELYKKEQMLSEFTTKVNKNKNIYMATFVASQRHATNIKSGEFVIFRISRNNQKFEFLSKINSWGRFCVPKIVIDTLKIHNLEIINFEVVKVNEKARSNTIKNSFNLANFQRGNVLFRYGNFITIVKNGTTPVTLPRLIEITPQLIELCYLIHGDGHYQEKLFFVNKDVGLHKFVIEQFFKIFGIPKEEWRVRLLYNNEEDKEIVKKKWQLWLNLKENQFYPTISKTALKTSNLGNLRIVIDKTLVAEIFRYIFDHIKEQTKGKNAIYALNGLLCAEGSAEKTPNSGLHKITINFSSKEKDMFFNILNEAGITKVKDRGDRFVIEGWSNCYNFFKIFFKNEVIPFNLHQSRCNMALSGFLEHSFTKTMNKYLSILNEKKSMNTNELIERTNHLGNSIRNILRKDQYKRFINSEGRGINRNPIKFSITPEGREFLTLIKIIKEVYNEKIGLG